MTYRLPTTKLTLPNTIEDIKFPVNRIADNITFNSKIQLIDDNFNKLLEYCNVVDNKSPFEYDEFYSFDDGEKYQLSSGESPTNHGYSHIEVVDTYVETQLIICATSNRIDFYTTNVEASSNLGSATQYDKVKDRGSMEFKNISYIKYNDEKLYVYDNVYKNIYVYSLLSFLTDDIALLGIKFLRQFYKINLTAFDFNSEICGITGSKLIKYNNDFNIKSEYVLDETNPIDIIASDNIYILYSNYIDVYDSLVNKISRINLIKIDSDNFIGVETSKFDDDVLYVISDKYIYKYNTSGQFIGYFNVSTNGLKDFSILEKADFEYVFALDENKLHIFKDKIVTFKLYDEKNLLDRELLDNLQIMNLELEQDYVYNSILQKVIFNVFLLYNSLIFKPFVQTDTNGVLSFDYLENLVNTEILQKNDIFYGQNEVFSYQTFNRAFREIYTIQEKILKLIEFSVVENTTNTLII
jgi:hypothetical protein